MQHAKKTKTNLNELVSAKQYIITLELNVWDEI